MASNIKSWEQRLEQEFKDMFNLVETHTGVSERQRLKDFITKEITEEVLRALNRDARLGSEVDIYSIKLAKKSIELCLIEILAKAEGMNTAREVRHLIKDYILYGESKD